MQTLQQIEVTGDVELLVAISFIKMNPVISMTELLQGHGWRNVVSGKKHLISI